MRFSFARSFSLTLAILLGCGISFAQNDSTATVKNEPAETSPQESAKDSTEKASVKDTLNADAAKDSSNAELEKTSIPSESAKDSETVSIETASAKDSSKSDLAKDTLILDLAKDSAESVDAKDSSKTDSAKIFFKRRPYSVGLIYEFASLKAKNLASVMTKDGKRYNVDVDVSNMLGVTGQYSVNEWISLFGVLGFQRFEVDYEPRDKSEDEDSFDAYNAFLQAGLEIGFSFLQAKNYQIRALGFFGGTVGFSHIGTGDYNDTPLFGYVRGIGVQLNAHRFALLAGFRSSHVYFHTYNDDHWKEDDYSLMIDFDTMSSPFFSIGIGF